ncbi:MAG: hypothetical protein A3G80_02450 [Betaproteobacteria bacterium RIFCSPLOWO2_12_FULL_62_13b]|nr:MAG: hypothetical protein A3G80_02450 [Betaproteobacteria bacterium RIFCSPLOWO2_12_FULL_62_13b]
MSLFRWLPRKYLGKLLKEVLAVRTEEDHSALKTSSWSNMIPGEAAIDPSQKTVSACSSWTGGDSKQIPKIGEQRVQQRSIRKPVVKVDCRNAFLIPTITVVRQVC